MIDQSHLNNVIGLFVISPIMFALWFVIYDLFKMGLLKLLSLLKKEESPSAMWLNIENQNKRENQRLAEELKAHADTRHRDMIRAIRHAEQKRIGVSKPNKRTRSKSGPTDAPSSAGGTPPQAAPLDARLSGSQARSDQTPKSDSTA